MDRRDVDPRSGLHEDQSRLHALLAEILRDVERAVEHAEDIDVTVGLHEVGDSVMPVQQDADLTIVAVPITYFWKLQEDFCALVDG